MKVIFMGSPDFAVASLEKVAANHEVVAVVTKPDKPKGRGKKSQSPAVADAARALGIDVMQPLSVRDESFVTQLAQLEPDVIVVVAYGKILPLAVLNLPEHGCINVHASLLPKYRGAAPIQRAIMSGDAVTGVSIMKLEEGMDTGPVARQVTCEIDESTTSGAMFTKLSLVGADALVATLDDLSQGKAEFVVQNHEEATYAPMLEKSEGRIDWMLPAIEVSARMRGVDPWPGAFCFLEDERIKLFRPRVVAGKGSPGEVIESNEQGLTIACGIDAVCIAELQAPGRNRVNAESFLRGKPIAVGTVLHG